MFQCTLTPKRRGMKNPSCGRGEVPAGGIHEATFKGIVLRPNTLIHRARTYAEQRPVFDAGLAEKAIQRSRGGEHLGGQVVRVKWHTDLVIPAPRWQVVWHPAIRQHTPRRGEFAWF